MSTEPFAIHQLDNGWAVRERHAMHETASVEPSANTKDNVLARFSVRYVRRHQQKFLTVVHLIGSTDEEQKKSLSTALRWAAKPHRFPLQPYWSRHRDPLYKGNYLYSIRMGGPINEAEAFEKLRRGLHTDDSIELEFQSIVHQIGVTA